MQRNHSGVLLLQMQMLNPIGSVLAMPAVPTEGFLHHTEEMHLKTSSASLRTGYL